VTPTDRQRVEHAERNLLALALRSVEAAARVATDLQAADFAASETRWLFGELQSAVMSGAVPTYHTILPNAPGRDALDCLADVRGRIVVSGLDALVKAVKGYSAARALSALLQARQADLAAGADGLDLAAQVVQEAAIIATPAVSDLILDTPAGLDAAIARAEKLAEKKGNSYLHFGLPRIESAFAVQPTQLVLIGGQTGKGKTNLCLTMAWSIGVIYRRPTLYINSEMTSEDMWLRLVSIGSGAAHTALRKGTNPEELEKARSAQTGYREGQLRVSDGVGSMDPAQLAAMMLHARAAYGAEVVFLDYIQRASAWDPSGRLQEWQSLYATVQLLKTLAVQHRLIVFVAAQVTGEGELAGAKGMAREADLILYIEELQRDPETGKPADENRLSDGQTHWCRCMKSRHTPHTGDSFALEMSRVSLHITEPYDERGVTSRRGGGASHAQ